MQAEIVLHTLTMGDRVVWKPDSKSISISFNAPRKVLSTSLLNGAYREDLTGVFNHNCGPDDGSHCRLLADTYEEHMRIMARNVGFDPDQTTGMGTAASMENVAIVVKKFRELTVTAIATAGVEGNGGRVGDPTPHYSPVEKIREHKPGTINIMLVIDADLPPGIMARALVTCTEAKTAALQELMAGSLYSTGLATGSGTDQTIVVTNPQSPLYFEGAGKHNKLGELIGLAVKPAVKEALLKQTGLSPDMQHSVLRRMKRFGISADGLWKRYQGIQECSEGKETFLDCLNHWERTSQAVVASSLYAHLMDQLQWELLAADEAREWGNEILRNLGRKCSVIAPLVPKGEIDVLRDTWEQMMLACLQKKIDQETGNGSIVAANR
ncbi:MAG TPA: adenosylcobinamide amidohydrolase [Patescibacteria group bacterium]|nr:adenosylcobinamide amidohydrolase [Patescibacteria group bacterium]